MPSRYDGGQPEGAESVKRKRQQSGVEDCAEEFARVSSMDQ